MNDNELNSLTERIIGSAFKVLNALGTGFVEEVYHNALVQLCLLLNFGKPQLDIKRYSRLRLVP